MRTLPTKIRQALEARPRVFAGDTAASGRVTISPDWFLTTEAADLGAWPQKKRPVRWFQDDANSVTQIEMPRPLGMSRDKSLSDPAPALQIDFANQNMDEFTVNTLAGQTGQPGYYWPLRGLSDMSAARWKHERNAWYKRILQNVMVHVYQGFGGEALSIEDAVTEGYLMLRFVGLIDDVQGGTDGKMSLKCRGMTGPLLVDQQTVVPLIPLDEWPMTRQRWIIVNTPVQAQAIDVTIGSQATPGDRRAVLSGSDVDAWYPQGATGSEIADGGFSIHGHRAADAFDGNPDTFYLGVGNSGPDRPWSFDWLEAAVGGEAVNAVFVSPVWGNYTMFVSVMEHGIWQGTDYIPYDPSYLFSSQPYAVDTGAAIPYVAQYGVPWEVGQEYYLPRVYAADRVRITFTNLVETEWGPWYYRVGVREFVPRFSTSPNAPSSLTTVHIDPIFLSADAHPDSGYVTVTQLTQVDALGDARVERFNGFAYNTEPALGVRMTRTGNGYYVLKRDGNLLTFGDAEWFGDLNSTGFSHPLAAASDVALTDDGTGYWLLRDDGIVKGFGSVAADEFHVSITANTLLFSLDSKNDQLWALEQTGIVHALRGATHYGNFAPYLPPNPGFPALLAISIRATTTGNGYWVAINNGAVSAFGDAPDNGAMVPSLPIDGDWRHSIWELIVNPLSDNGYMLLKGDGSVYPFGDVDFYPGPISGNDEQRIPGDYKDLADIVKDFCLWSGFWFKEDLDTSGIGGIPDVFGTIETTGTYVNTPLNSDFFDKRAPIDILNELAAIVGYYVGERDDGGVVWRSLNIWESGNFDEDMNHTDEIPEIDERVDLTQMGVDLPAKPIRSPIVIGSAEIDPHNPNQVKHVTYEPPWGGLLHGMIRPLEWTYGMFRDLDEMQIMAELIALRIWLQLRVAQIDCWINPAVEPGDQVRPLERNTSDTFIYFVTSMHDEMVLGTGSDAGKWTMTLQGYWMGTADQWVITADDVSEVGQTMPDRYQLSEKLLDWLKSRPHGKTISPGGANINPPSQAITTATSSPTGDLGVPGAGPP